MTAGAVVFMALSWSLVLGLTAWSFGRILRQDRDRLSSGPESPGTSESSADA